ncbi:MAG: type VI secretion system baseplate subunit TssF [Pirellula sp.]|jgi:type VI secretion system protein ImpG
MDALFLEQYDRELAYLREMGSEFASRYPNLAGRLGMDQFHCSDPFVERLLEGFAFLTARIHRRLDAEYPQFLRGFFEAVFPHYVRPIPSVAMFQFEPSANEGSLVEGYKIDKGARLIASPVDRQQTGVRFDTTASIELWPIKIRSAQFVSRDTVSPLAIPNLFHSSSIRGILHLELETTLPANWSDLSLDRLRLHLRGAEVAHQLFESCIAHTELIAVAGDQELRSLEQQAWRILDEKSVHAPGFETSEQLFPSESRSFSGYRLLQEYHIMLEKFLFVEIRNLREHLRTVQSRRLNLLLGISSIPGRAIERTNAEHIALHCVPAINLFKKRTDRIILDHSQHEHHLVVDRSRPLDYEVWGIESMAAHMTSSPIETECLPVYAPSHSANPDAKAPLYFSTERRPRLLSAASNFASRSSYDGTEVFVSLTDASQNPSRQDYQQLSSTVYCTQRDLAILPPARGWRNAFQFEGAAPIAKLECIQIPTTPKMPLVSDDGEVAWRLVNHLNPHYTSLEDSIDGGAATLRELMRLYSHQENTRLRFDGIKNVRHEATVARVPISGPLTFARGVDVEITMDETAFDGGGAFLLSAVLEEFIARYVTLNSFTRTKLVTTQRGAVYEWPPRMGTTPVL